MVNIQLDMEAKRHVEYIDRRYGEYTDRTFHASKVLTREDVAESERGTTPLPLM